MSFGAGLKALFYFKFSFFVFCYTQVIIDLESVFNIIFGRYPIHGFLHTYLGALVTMLFCGMTANFLRSKLSKLLAKFKVNQIFEIELTHKIIYISAFVGSFSHIVLDSFMHADMKPLSPLNESNVLLNLISLSTLHLACMVPGIGAIIWFESYRKKKSA
jgi:membrane-bound metal-dependent hydrolase YbcI (DUF457 family)